VSSPRTIACRVVTPEASLFDEGVAHARIPAWDGLLGVLPGHAAMVIRLGTGELRLDFADVRGARGGSRSFVIDGGVAQVAENRIIILADRAFATESLTESEARGELAAAERSPAGPDRARAVRLAQAKLRAAEHARGRGI
jgi:F-type H+-transporting ATPase subunit epsilon